MAYEVIILNYLVSQLLATYRVIFIVDRIRLSLMLVFYTTAKCYESALNETLD